VIQYNAVMDWRESEIIDTTTKEGLVGSMSYTIQLSVQPNATVRVNAAKAAEPNADCVLHDDGLYLGPDSHFMFDSSNWNEPQTVSIDVRRNATTYQGSSVTLFLHAVESEDPDWRSPFLRPMRVAITDDDECTNGAQKYDAIEKSAGGKEYIVRKCGCSESFFVAEEDLSFCNSATECTRCPAGMLCEFQQRLEEALLESGKYRRSPTSLHVVNCPIEAACVGNATAGDRLCQDGHTGPLCMVCILNGTSRYEWSGESCTRCDNWRKWEVYGVLVLLGLAFLAIVVSIIRRNAPSANDDLPRWEEFVGRATAKYKIVTKFLQASEMIYRLVLG
jgi:hypothetical protein